LIARVHVCRSIVRLGQRDNLSLQRAMGHVVFIPQDTTRLLDLLPMLPASLPDVVTVVTVIWTGRSRPDKARLRSQFTICTGKVLNTLKWLVHNHEDYRHNVKINGDMLKE
jgi:hypothetical protein